MFIKIYNMLITILYPLVIKRYIKKRLNNGKEDKQRFNERTGRPKKPRPEGKLVWLHGASVGGHHRHRHLGRCHEQTPA